MATVPRLQRYYQGATTSCPRMSFGLLFSPSGSAGACRGSCPPMGRSRRRTGPATDRGLDFHAGNPLSSLFAHGQEQDLPGSLATHPVTLRRSTTPDDPLRLAISGASGAAPTRLTMKASSFTDFEAARRFVTCCLRFTTGVTARHARLASGWRAAPLPGGSRTRWIATRGFSSCHPPLQGFPWRNKRSAKPWNRRHWNHHPHRIEVPQRGSLGLVTRFAMRYRRAHGGSRRRFRHRPDAGRGRQRDVDGPHGRACATAARVAVAI